LFNLDTMQRWEPTQSLRPYIQAYLVIESEQDQVNRLLPDTNIFLALRYKGIVYQHDRVVPALSVAGMQKTARPMNYTAHSSNIVVQFKTTGASAFFRQPMHELFEAQTALTDLTGDAGITRLEEQLQSASAITGKIALIERFLLSRLKAQTDPLIDFSLKKINDANGIVRIRPLAADLHISQDAFEKRFRKIVGTSPKQYASIARMKAIVETGRKGRPLTELALAAGFFDQAHFNKDFKLFTGQTPTEFFAIPPVW
jgi:AraC-like DNA-binding protein